MKIIIDTHILIWLLYKKSSLSKHVLAELEDSSNTFYVSSLSLVEIAMKNREGKLKLDVSFKSLVDEIEGNQWVTILPLKPKHIITFNTLTTNQDHKDPFDQLIISQAISDRMAIISDDAKFLFYRKQGLTLIEN